MASTAPFPTGIRGGLKALVLSFLMVCAPVASAAGQDGRAAVEVMPQLGASIVIRSLAFSPDGRLALTGSYENFKLWDISSGRLLRVFTGHASWVDTLAFSPDGSLILSASADSTLNLWDVTTGRLLHKLTGHAHWIRAAAFSPDGRRILSASEDRTIRLWDSATGALLKSFDPGMFAINSVAFAPDGRRFLLAGAGVTLWDSETNQPLMTFAYQSDFFMRLTAFSADGQRVVATDGGGIWHWDMASGAAVTMARLAKSPDDIRAGAFSPDRRQVLLGRTNGSIDLIDAATGDEIRSFAGHPGEVASLAFSPDGRHVLSGGVNSAILLWDAVSTTRMLDFGARSSRVRTVAFSPDNAFVLTASTDRTLKLWDARSGRLAQVLAGHTDAVLSAAFSPDGRLVISGSKDGSLQLWDTASGRQLDTFTGHPSGVSSVAFSSDGHTIMSGGDDGTIFLWDLTFADRRTLETFPGTIRSLAFSPDGRLAVSASSHVRVWDVASGTLLKAFDYHLDGVASVAFSPDGQRILSGGEDGKIILLDLASDTIAAYFAGQKADPSFIYFPQAETQLKEQEGHYGAVYSVAFAPDGRHILSGGQDGEVLLWDIASRKRVRRFAGHLASVLSVAFSADGERIVSGGNDTTTRLWSATTGEQTVMLVSGEAHDDWLALTPAGFFNAPGQGTDLVTVVHGVAVYGVNQLYQALYRPDLVEERLAGDPFGRYAKAAGKLDLRKLIDTGPPPRVIIRKTERLGDEVEVTATLEDQAGGVGKVEWRIDGRTQALANERGAAILTPDTDITLTRRFALKPGRNVISVTAYNAQNLFASPAAEIVIDAAGISTEARGRLHVLAIGVDDYADPALRLANAAADAAALGKALMAVGQNVYDDVNVVPVLDREVTDAGLDRVFTELAGKIRPEDKFVFFIAGHGLTVDGKYYFLPQDFAPAAGDTYASKGISQDRWQEWFARIAARSSILLYDTCESGSVARSASTEKAAAMDRLTQAVGINVIAASDADQPAREGYRGHGLFTWALLDALANGDENKDTFIEIFELANHVGAVVPKISRQEFGFEQRPRTKTLSNFPLGLRVAGIAPSETISREPDRIITRAVSVELTKGGADDREQKAFTLVRLLEVEGSMALIARDGRELGYVPTDALAEFQ
ncbi:MAG: caspase family protein [Parvibaculaceae bacterium]